MIVTCHYPNDDAPLTIGRDYKVYEMDRYMETVRIRNDNGEIKKYSLAIFDYCWR